MTAGRDPDAADNYADYADGQAQFIATLQQGPSAFPDGLFSGSVERAILGLKTHANTISHARLVALEDSFPKLRELLGDAAFNAISREYIETPAILICAPHQLGAQFADFLHLRDHSEQAVDLAKIEWAWLQSYHSEDEVALTMSDIAALDEPTLLALPIKQHPALRLVGLSAPLAPQLDEWVQTDLFAPIEAASALLICRPDAAVIMRPINAQMAAITSAITEISQMGNLLAFALETYDEASALPSIFGLIQAGAICKADVLAD